MKKCMLFFIAIAIIALAVPFVCAADNTDKSSYTTTKQTKYAKTTEKKHKRYSRNNSDTNHPEPPKDENGNYMKPLHDNNSTSTNYPDIE